jgi:hypothetical protein
MAELQSKKKAVQQEINQLEDKIGGREEKFGSDGILFSLREQCYQLTAAGKYTYEICPFGKAYQRDIGSPSSSGTSLGTWKVSIFWCSPFVRHHLITLTHSSPCIIFLIKHTIRRRLYFMMKMVLIK